MKCRAGRVAALLASCALLAACAGAPEPAVSSSAAPPATTATTSAVETVAVDTGAGSASTPRTDEPGEPAESTAASTGLVPASPSEPWTRVTLPSDITALLDGRFESFVADGRFWVFDPADASVLHGTADGAEWLTVDVAAAIPDAAALGSAACTQHDGVVEARQDGFTIVLAEENAAELPEYVFTRFWLVDVAGGEVTGAVSTRGTALETLLQQGGKSFRTQCAAGLRALGDVRYLAGSGNWFTPGATGYGDGYLAALGADGSWDLVAEPGTPYGDGWHLRMDRLEQAGDALLVLSQLGSETGSEDGFDAWISDDGRAMEHVHVPVTESGRVHYIDAAGGAGLAVLSWVQADPEHDVVTVSTSADGRTWMTTVLSEAGQARGVVVDHEGFRVFGLDGHIPDAVSTMWISNDGVSWTAEEIGLPADLALDRYRPDVTLPVTAFGDGLVTILDDIVYVSGLDWPAAS